MILLSTPLFHPIPLIPPILPRPACLLRRLRRPAPGRSRGLRRIPSSPTAFSCPRPGDWPPCAPTSVSDHIRKPSIVTVADIHRAYPAQGAGYRSLLAFLQDIRRIHGGLPAHLVLFGDASQDEASDHNHVATYTFHAPQTVDKDWVASSDDLLAELLDSIPREYAGALGRRRPHPRPYPGSGPAIRGQGRRIRDPFRLRPGGFHLWLRRRRRSPGWEGCNLIPAPPPPSRTGLEQPQGEALRAPASYRRSFPSARTTTKPAARDSLVAILNSGASRF